jgi:hypothetical protein
MATGGELKKLAQNRRKTAKMLLDAGDWEMAVYMMAMCLELALKSASCKTLSFENYPETSDPEDRHFKSHKFDRLLRISGLLDIFSIRVPMKNIPAFFNWSIFTDAFLFADKDYTAMRYDMRMQASFNRAKAHELYRTLYGDKDSILKTMTRYRKW